MRIREEKDRLILETGPKDRDSFEKYQQHMMEAAPYLLRFEWRAGGDLCYLRGAGRDLCHFLKSDPSETELKALIDAFYTLEGEMESFLLDEERLLFRPDWILFEDTPPRLRLLYVPFEKRSGQGFWKQMSELLWKSAVLHGWRDDQRRALVFDFAQHVYQSVPQEDKKRPSPILRVDPEKERALDQLIAAHEEPEPYQRTQKQAVGRTKKKGKAPKKRFSKWTFDFPIVLKD